MRILITGGFGFIGGRLALYLNEIGHQIVLASRSPNPPPKRLKKAKVVVSSWNSDQSLEEMCYKIDLVIHAAGMNSQDSASDPVAALEFNGLVTSRLVTAAIRSGVKRFIYLSTAHVYSSPLTGNITENTFPRNLHPYATSHMAGENFVLSANQSGKIEGIVTRLSNAFGSPVDKNANCWTLLINDLCRQSVIKNQMILNSSGLQTRNFISLFDVVRSIGHLSTLNKKDVGNGLFNVGGEWTATVLEVASTIQKRCEDILGCKPKIVSPLPYKDETHTELEYDIGMLKNSGFQLASKNNYEIDDLLRFCISNF